MWGEIGVGEVGVVEVGWLADLMVLDDGSQQAIGQMGLG